MADKYPNFSAPSRTDHPEKQNPPQVQDAVHAQQEIVPVAAEMRLFFK
jgi:hypothetical protein